MNTRIAAGFLGTALAFLAPLAHAQFGNQPSKLELIKIRDDIYVISNVAVPGLVTALITNEGVLLVDDKFEIDHDNIVAMLKTVTNQPVKYVINTHYHGDHSGGNAKFQALDSLVVASDAARARMVAVNQSGVPDITLASTATIHLGGKTVEVHRVGPAHTNGDVVVLFPEHRVLSTGDIFANGPGTSAQLVDHAGGGSAKAWPEAVAQALELSFDTVIPGHGLISTRTDLEAYHARTLRFRETLAALVSQGKSRADIEAVMRGQFDWEDFHVRSLDGLINEFR